MKSLPKTYSNHAFKLFAPMIAVLFLPASDGFSQSDTLVINNAQVIARVTEVTEDAVKFTYPGEDIVNTVYKNSIQRITFRNGRVQTFAETTSLRSVNSVEDFEKVSITRVESEVRALSNLGEVSSKSKGTTTLANQERVKERAYRKMKISAAMRGANIIYLIDQRTEGNTFGGYYQSGSSTETSISGVAYTNQPPRYEEFVKLINSEKYFQTVEQYKMWSGAAKFSKEPVRKELIINKIVNENGIITIEGELEGTKRYTKFRLANFTDDYFIIFFQDKKTSYNYKLLF